VTKLCPNKSLWRQPSEKALPEGSLSLTGLEPNVRFATVGQKLPLKLEQVWAIRIRLEIEENIRELAMFNMAIDCKLRSCDMVKLLVLNISQRRRSAGSGPSHSAENPSTYSMRRSKAALIYKKAKNLRTVQLLLGHTNMLSTVR
jgi:integrase